MTDLFNATVEYEGVSAADLATIENVVSQFDTIDDLSFDRSKVVFTTDLDWFIGNPPIFNGVQP